MHPAQQWTSLAVTLALWSNPTTVFAQQTPPPLSLSQTTPLERARNLNQQAIELYQAGRYQDAIPLAEAFLVILRQELGGNPIDVAVGLNNLALLYQNQGRYGEAEPLFLEALNINQEQLGNNHPDVANSLNNLASLYQEQGRYGEAEPLHLEALTIRREQLGNNNPRVATSLNSLAGLYWKQGRYGEAEPRYLEALAIYRDQLGNNHPDVATSLSNLALLYWDQGRYGEAEPRYLEALAIYRQQLDGNHPLIATNLNNLALLYWDQGRYDEAEPRYLEALAIYRDQLDDNHPLVAISLHNLASLYRSQARHGEAESFYLEALAIYRDQLGDDHPDVANILHNLAWLYWAQGDLTQALQTQKAGLVIEEVNLALNLATLADAQRRDYAATLERRTNFTLSLHLQAAAASPDAAEIALTTLLRRKGRVLDAGIDSLQQLRQNLSPADQSRLNNLTAARQQLANLTFNPPPNLNRTELVALETEINDLEAVLARQSALFQADAQPVDIPTIAAQLPTDGVLVEYVRYQPFDPTSPQNPLGTDRYAAYLLFPDGDIQAVDLGDAADIDAAINTFSQHLRNPTQSATASAHVLSALVLDPLQPSLTGRSHLLISPDSQLNRIPFEALRSETGEYLVENYQISYLNSGRDLLKLGVVAPSQQPAVIVANPDYVVASTSVQIASSRSGDQRSVALSQFQVGPLPGTATEAAAIRPLLPDATVLTDREATENALKQVQAPAILHIATHGFFLENVARPDVGNGRGLGIVASETPFPRSESVAVENPLLRSGLALAGFNERASGEEDGVLTALEVAQLNLLGTQLVVLSACETGLGDIANGEGVYGLRRAFAIAGAETQVLSLWQVDDTGTSELMAAYYEQLLDGMGRAEALREVQLEMINSQSRYAHPFYWAAFITTGNWQPLE